MEVEEIDYLEEEDYSYNPREDDNLGTMVCFHRRYHLGDKHEYRADDYSGWDDLYEAILEDNPNCVILPLYMYDHSGISISTSYEYPYNDKWDSGQVGFIFASTKAMRESFGKSRITKAIIEKTHEVLLAEVAAYNRYLNN